MRSPSSISVGVVLALVASLAAGQAPAALSVMGFPGSSNWPIFTAQERGEFARHGIEVHWSAAPDSQTQLAELLRGGIDIAMTALDNIVARDEADLFAFLGATRGARASLMVTPEVRSFVDLKNRALAVDARASGYALVLMEMLRRAGLAATDYELISVGGSRERWQALQSGKVAGALLNAPQDAAAHAAGFMRLADAAQIIGPYQASVGAARRSWAAANADSLMRFIRAYVATVDWLYEPANRAAAIELLQRRLAISAESAARSYDELLHPTRGSLSPRAAIDAEGVRTVLRLRKELLQPTQPLGDISRYYDGTYYERALRHD